MAGQTGTAFPFAAVAVVVAFVSSVLLKERPFELLRTPETTKSQYRPARALEINARLWEDPFTAAQRFEAERAARCKEKPAPAADKSAAPAPECDEAELAQRRSVEYLIRRWPATFERRRLLLPVLVPGNPLVGAEEARRRTRYAVLAGLNAQGYVPNDAEHIGLIDFEQMSDEPGRRPRRVVIPYERLQPPEVVGPDATRRAYDEVLLLWVDEAGLRQPKLDSFARLLEKFARGCELPGRREEREATFPCADLAIIGPSSSDALHTAVDDLKRANPEMLGRQAIDGYRYLARAQIYNTAATADPASLGVTGKEDAAAAARSATVRFDALLSSFVTAHLARIIGAPPAPRFSYRSTIANEDALVAALISELNARGASREGNRIVLLSEWDSLYAQTLVDHLRRNLGASTTHVRVDVHNYLRGIDGVTARDEAKSGATAGDKGIVEWPEARDQRDYLRRLADLLAQPRPGEPPVAAIGVLGSDVHDKLLALQALRDAFPDKPFFTTDLDARYLHPRVLPFTRNLIVATSLPLVFEQAPVQETAPPFRDVYQTSTFLAARLAAGGARDAILVNAVDAALANPRLYEVGLGGAVLLDGAPERAAGAGRALTRAIGIAGLTAVAVLLLWYWPSTPALRKARQAALHAVPRLGADGRIVAAFVGAHCGMLAFGFASLIELVWPGHVTFVRALAWAALAGAAAFAVIYPGPCWFADHLRMRLPARIGAGENVQGLVRLLLLSGAVALALAGVSGTPFGTFEPVVWMEGVSGWPSQLVRVLALMTMIAAFDYAWFGTLTSAEKLSTDLGFDEPTLFRRKKIRTLRAWVEQYSIAFWRYPRGQRVEFEHLWTDYRRRGGSLARIARVLFWAVITGLFLYWLFGAFGGEYRFEVPVRGEEHRDLMLGTLVLESVAFVLLVVATADATMLACRFVRHLTRGRSIYPEHVIERFAAEMGPALAAAWRTRISTGGADVHTLLDDWIDIQILARRTADVAPLVFLPSGVLALLVVAHSRLFDSWALTTSVALMFSFYLLWLVTLAAILKFAADRARREALRRMRADLRWLQGAREDLAKLAKPMEGLIAAVEAERRGAFADLFDQPLLKAILVPLGGASGVQLLDYFVLVK